MLQQTEFRKKGGSFFLINCLITSKTNYNHSMSSSDIKKTHFEEIFYYFLQKLVDCFYFYFDQKSLY